MDIRCLDGIQYKKCSKCGRYYPLESRYGSRIVKHCNTYCKPCTREIERSNNVK